MPFFSHQFEYTSELSSKPKNLEESLVRGKAYQHPDVYQSLQSMFWHLSEGAAIKEWVQKTYPTLSPELKKELIVQILWSDIFKDGELFPAEDITDEIIFESKLLRNA